MSATKKSWIDNAYYFSINQYLHWRHHFKEYFWAIVIAIVIRSMIVTIYKIPTPSMVPTIQVGDMLIANHFYYGLKIPFTYGLNGLRLKAIQKPEVGNVIIFQAPKEENFYIITLNAFSQQGHDLLLKFNKLSSFKRPISLEKNHQTNYLYLSEPFRAQEFSRIFLHQSLYDDFISAIKTNRLTEPYLYITLEISDASQGYKFLNGLEKKLNKNKMQMSYFPKQENFTSIFIPKSAYESEQKNFEKASVTGSIRIIAQREQNESIFIYNVEKQKHYMTYYENRYKGWWRSLIAPPISITSLLASVFINSPPFLFYRLLMNTTQRIFLQKDTSFLSEVKWYPNRFNNTTKDFVKRLIAKGGDTVEIINKKIYVNDVAYQWTENAPPKNQAIANIYLEHIPRQSKDKNKGKGKTYQIRINPHDNILPKEKFPTTLWPLDPNIRAYGLGEDYKDNFGPIVVPKNHYFALGDNRDESLDSRYWGCVPEWALKGKPMIIIWPFHRFQPIK